ncbi:MAG: phosphonoacetaldehyde hydrolase [Gemmataceae bacterium]
MSTPTNNSEIKLVVFDWAGTTVDFGCFAPVAAFLETFARHDIHLTPEQARGPMGLHKKDHIRALLHLPEISEQWKYTQGSSWTEDDVERLFQEHFVPMQLEAIHKHAKLIPGLLETVQALRKQGIKIATSTGYFKKAAELVYEAAASQGYSPDSNRCAEDVPTGRPAPWMIFEQMEQLGIYPTSSVVKVGDTVPDIEEGRNAGVWTIGVSKTSSEVGLTEQEWNALPEADKQVRIRAVEQKLVRAGAHYVIDSIAELPLLLPKIQERIRNTDR